MKKTLLLTLLALAWVGTAGPASAFDTCTPTVHIVYFGATAPNVSINEAGKNLYGPPLSTCSADVKTYRGLRDLNGDGIKESCVQFYVGARSGSCEGVNALDKRLNNFNVCQPTAGSTTLTPLSSLQDETGSTLFDNLAGSDVAADLCAPLIQGGITRPQIFDQTESRPFVTPFVLIANRSVESLLPASRKFAPSTCAYGAGDCLRLELGLTKDQLKGIFANNNQCDWRWLDAGIDPSTPAPIVGAVMRNRLSGTRNNFNATMLENLRAGQGSIFVAGTSDVINRVNTNRWCGNDSAECGESATGVIGGQISPCQALGTNAVSLGFIGADRLINIDPDTPLDPFDDYGVRGVSTDNYDPIEYQGAQFNKANVRCGHYEYWSFERLYYDNVYAFPGSFREAAVQELIARTSTDSAVDATVVAPSQMFVSRARDGSPVFPTGPYNAFCHQP